MNQSHDTALLKRSRWMQSSEHRPHTQFRSLVREVALGTYVALISIVARAMAYIRMALSRIMPEATTVRQQRKQADVAAYDDARSRAKASVAHESLALALIAISARLIHCDGAERDGEYQAFLTAFPMPHASRDSIRKHFDEALLTSSPDASFVRHLHVLTEGQPSMRRIIVRRLFDIAAADQPVQFDELRFLYRVAEILAIDTEAFLEIAEHYIGVPTDDPYDLLQLTKHDGRDQLKHHYHGELQAFHPDRIAHWQRQASSEEEQLWLAMMERRATAVNEAYHTLSRRRQFRA